MTMHPEDPLLPDDLEGGVEMMETPRHGFQGDRGALPARPVFPRGLTVAISRETGARGATIGQRVARKLGWEMYDQEMLEFMAQDDSAGRNTQEAPADVAEWIESRIQVLLREQTVSQHPSIINMARVILLLAAQGNAVLIGRGAGFLLEPATALHVRVIAPLSDRIAYMSQLLRLSTADAAEHVRKSDQRRADYLATHFHRQVDEIHQYDLLVNTSRLGEDEAAELVCHAIRARGRQG
jgi:cytidylate kinase